MLDIRLRPSGGRGEYEYRVSKHEVLKRRITVRVPLLGVEIPTDVTCVRVDGKPRLRRADKDNRSKLNVPPLVAAIAGLPEPRREDNGVPSIPLKRKGYVVDSIQFEVIKEPPGEIVIEPRLLRPRHAEYLDVEARIQDLLDVEAADSRVHALLEAVRKGLNAATALTSAAAAAHASKPAEIVTVGSPHAISTPEEEIDEIVADFSGPEGQLKIRLHRRRERNQKLVARAKRRFEKRHGTLFCECCGIDFKQFYSEPGDGFIEAHHVVPLGKLKEEEKVTHIDELVMLCSNCHRMVHRTASCSLDEIKALVAKNNSFINHANIKKLAKKSAGEV